MTSSSLDLEHAKIETLREEKKDKLEEYGQVVSKTIGSDEFVVI